MNQISGPSNGPPFCRRLRLGLARTDVNESAHPLSLNYFDISVLMCPNYTGSVDHFDASSLKVGFMDRTPSKAP